MMSRKLTHLILSISLTLCLLLCSLSPTSPVHVSATPAALLRTPLPGSSVFQDELTTTTYEDSVATTANGWGTGSISLDRDISGVNQLYYISTADPVVSVKIQGRKLYAVLDNPTSNVNTLRIWNISDPTDPQILDAGNGSDDQTTGEIDGDLWYVATSGADGDPRFFIYNVSDPTTIPAPVYDSGDLGSNSITDLEVQGRFLYITSTSGLGHEIGIYNVEDPSAPYLTFDISTNTIQGCFMEGQILYQCLDSSLRLWNFSNPYSFSSLDSLSLSGENHDVIVENRVAYVAAGSSGVHIVDCNDPTNIALLATIDTPGDARDVELQGNTLVVADSTGSSGVRFIDVSDPSNPVDVTIFTPSGHTDLDIEAGVLACANPNGIYLYSIGELIDPAYYWVYGLYDALDVEVHGDIAYIAAGSDGLVTLNVSNPQYPVFLDQIKQPSSPYYTSVDVVGRKVFVTDYSRLESGVVSFDATDPSNLVFLDYLTGSGYNDVCVAGDVAFSANGTEGMYVTNVSNPYSLGPQLDQVTDIDNCTTVAVQGHFAYAGGTGTGSGQGVYIYDISDLSNLRSTSFVAPTQVADIAVTGDFLAVANGDFGVALYGITDPWVPIFCDSIQFTGSYKTLGVAIFGNYILAAEDGGGIHLLNATDPFDLQLISTYGAGISWRNIEINGDFIYAARETSLWIFRLFNSVADNWETTTKTAQSLSVDSTDRTIENATLTVDRFDTNGLSFTWRLSADGGAHWEWLMLGTPLTFAYQGSDLRWRANLTSTRSDMTPILYNVSITYEFNDLPSPPVFTTTGDLDIDGDFIISWDPSTDDGASISYQLQMSTSDTFSPLLYNWNLTSTSRNITSITDGTYYFRVRALDDDDEYGSWSATDSITVTLPIPGIPPLFFYATLALNAILIILVIIIYLRMRK